MARKSELISTILISLAAVLSAWSCYQANRWYGNMTISFGESNNLRNESAKANNISSRQILVDVSLFLNWMTQKSEGNQKMALALEDRFRKEFNPAFQDWVLIKEKGDAGLFPKGTPFELPSYKLKSLSQVEALVAQAEEKFAKAKHFNQTGDNYMFLVVIFSLSLFFSAIASKLESTFSHNVITVISILFSVGGILFMTTLPMNVAF